VVGKGRAWGVCVCVVFIVFWPRRCVWEVKTWWVNKRFRTWPSSTACGLFSKASRDIVANRGPSPTRSRSVSQCAVLRLAVTLKPTPTLQTRIPQRPCHTQKRAIRHLSQTHTDSAAARGLWKHSESS
jgi:hypothetical protein